MYFRFKNMAEAKDQFNSDIADLLKKYSTSQLSAAITIEGGEAVILIPSEYNGDGDCISVGGKFGFTTMDQYGAFLKY